jgi:tetratricopeptide (TPR) repeat protein
LAIAERLAQAEPDRADYQRDLSVSYERVGDLYRALGQGDSAREAYLKSLAIAERLAQAEPDRADYQRDLSVSYKRVGDLYRALGQGDSAREAYLKSLAIASVWRRPSRIGRTTSATSRCRTTKWATCTARWARGIRPARPT